MQIKLWSRRKKILVSILTFFILILLIVRILAPSIIVKELNQKLENSNDVIAVHIDDMSMSLLFGSYRFEGVQVWPKGQTPLRPLVTIPVLQFSLSWSQLLHLHILSDADIEEMEIILSPRMVDVFKTGDKKSKVSEKNKNIPAKMVHQLVLIDVNRVGLTNCKISIENVAGFEKRQEFLTGISGQLTNISDDQSRKRKVPSLLSLKGSFFGKAPLIITGKYIPAKQKADLTLQAENVPLVDANPPLLSYVPLTFTAGTLDVWSEAVMEGTEIRGYIKPFFRKVKVLKRDEKFVSTKHFFIEVVTALSNLLLRDGGTKTTATMVEFTKIDGKFDIKTSEALKTAIKNGYVAPLNPGFESKYFPTKANVQFE